MSNYIITYIIYDINKYKNKIIAPPIDICEPPRPSIYINGKYIFYNSYKKYNMAIRKLKIENI